MLPGVLSPPLSAWLTGRTLGSARDREKGPRCVAQGAIANPIQIRPRTRPKSGHEPLHGGNQHMQVRRVYGGGAQRVWSSLFPWGQRVNLPVKVVKRPRLHVLEGAATVGAPLLWWEKGREAIIGAPFPGWTLKGQRFWAHSFSPPPSPSVYRAVPTEVRRGVATTGALSLGLAGWDFHRVSGLLPRSAETWWEGLGRCLVEFGLLQVTMQPSLRLSRLSGC